MAHLVEAGRKNIMKLVTKGNPAKQIDLVSPRGQRIICVNCDAEFMTTGGEAQGPCNDLYYTVYAHEGRRFFVPQDNELSSSYLYYFGWVVTCPQCGQIKLPIWFTGKKR